MLVVRTGADWGRVMSEYSMLRPWFTVTEEKYFQLISTLTGARLAVKNEPTHRGCQSGRSVDRHAQADNHLARSIGLGQAHTTWSNG
jgi:hypothetical protein